ncbi:MAG: LytR C-terminal domain-containing protein, partial [Acidimicrobiales bacterium]
HLDGFQALQVVRARHLQYLPPGMARSAPHTTWPHEDQSDLARIRRDHEFLRVLATAVARRGLSSPGTDLSVVNAVAGQLTVDGGLTVPHMVNLVLTYHGVSIDAAPQWTLPVLVDDTPGGYTYKGFGKGDVEFPSQPLGQSIINRFLGIGDATDSLTGKPLPRPGSVTVSVLNGTGAFEQATTTSESLGRLGFHMLQPGTSPPVGRVAETLVTYAQRTPADEAAAQLVARSLSGSVVMDYGPTAGGADVTVTTGTSFSVNPTAPGASTVTGPAKGGATSASPTSPTATTAVATSSGSPAGTAPAGSPSALPGFSAPSPAVTPLKPYDPRACPTGVKGNATGWGS